MNSILICGAGSSGIGALKLLAKENYLLSIFEEKIDDRKMRQIKSIRPDARIVSSIDEIQNQPFDFAVISPGFSLDSPLLHQLARKGIALISELEFGWRTLQNKVKVLAITGSNGKSTLTKLCAHILNEAGFKVEIGGNYGKPVAEIAADKTIFDVLVLEVSSFQLETTHVFKPNIGIVLNIFPNHLDRHKSREEYTRLKASLLKNLTQDDYAIANYEFLPAIRKYVPINNAKWFSFGNSSEADCFYENGCLVRKAHSIKVPLQNTMFDNAIMSQTAAAAFLAMEYFNVATELFVQALKTFEPLKHRMQFIDKVCGISFIDDSKATNLGATIAALKMLDSPIRLIAGGLPKGESYLPATDILKQKVVKAYLIGSAAKVMQQEWQNAIPCENCEILEHAFKKATEEAKPGEIILLSPACASFDQFASYAERGEKFIELIRNIKVQYANR